MSLSNNFPAVRPSLLLDFANTGRLDPRVTFTRSTTGTYYDGVTTAMAEQNLLTYSQDFTQSASGQWSKFNLTITSAAATAPDGTNTACSLVPTTDSTRHEVHEYGNLPAASAYTYSCYVKANGYSLVALRESATSGASAVFDLSGSGAVVASNTTGGVTVSNAAIVALASGWFRVSATFSGSGAQQFQLNVLSAYTSGDPNSATFAGDGTSGIYAWGAQVEQRSTVTAYTPTTSSPITNYIPQLMTAAANVARFDHNPTTGEALGLLIEEQRTNLLTYSSAFDNAAWSKSAVTVTADTIVAPDGTVTAEKLAEGTGLARHMVYRNNPVAIGAVHCGSVFAKAGERRYVCLNLKTLSGASPRYSAVFDLQTGTVTATDSSGSPTGTAYSISAADANGYYRCSVSMTMANTPTFLEIGLSNVATPGFSEGTPYYTGNGTSGIYIWGAQLEAGAFATSYIPTTSAQVTRSADAASMTGTNFSSWYNPQQGTVCAEAIPDSGASNRAIAFMRGSASDYNEMIGLNWTGGFTPKFAVNSGGVTQASLVTSGTTSTTSAMRFAAAYKTDDFAFITTGESSVRTDTSGVVPTVNYMQIGAESTVFGGYLCGHIKRIAYYPTRLPNATLQALTA